jgi:hypothetical protein
MQIKGLLTKLTIPLSLVMFSSGCYTVVSIGTEVTPKGEEGRVESNFGWGSYYTEHFYEEPGYIRLYNMEIYGIFDNGFRHYNLHKKPVWNQLPKAWANFNKSFERNRSQIHIRNNNGLRNERPRASTRRDNQIRPSRERNSGRR